VLTSLRQQVRRLVQVGPRKVLGWALVGLEGRAWERYFSAHTRREPGDEEALGENNHYEPLPWVLLRRAVAALKVSSEDVFLDYGAGKGRVLLMVARHALRRVIGVELFAPLADVARANVTAAGARLRSPVEVVTADAMTYEVPDDVSVVFLFNPFVGAVMAAVQANLLASLVRRPRAMRVLYAHASDQPNLFADCAWLKAGARVPVGMFQGMNVTVYEHAVA
jgi:predicted RNA methylase